MIWSLDPNGCAASVNLSTKCHKFRCDPIAFFRLAFLTLMVLLDNKPVSAQGQLMSFIVPNGLLHTNGNSIQNEPFNETINGDNYQQVYGASEFSALTNGGGYIEWISFRTDGAGF